MHQYLLTTFAKYKSTTIKTLIFLIILVFVITAIILYFNFFTAFSTLLGPKELNEGDLKTIQQTTLTNLIFRNYFKIHKNSKDYKFNYYFSDYQWGTKSIYPTSLPSNFTNTNNYSSTKIDSILNNIKARNPGNINVTKIQLFFSQYELHGFISTKDQVFDLTELFKSLNYSRYDVLELLQLVTKPEKLGSLIHLSDSKEELVKILSRVITDSNLRIAPNILNISPSSSSIDLNKFKAEHNIVFLYFKFNNSSNEYIFTSSVSQDNENTLNDKNIESFNISVDAIDTKEKQVIYELKDIVSSFKDSILSSFNLKSGEEYDKMSASLDNSDEQKLYLSIKDRFYNHKLNESVILNVNNKRGSDIILLVVLTILLFILLELFLFSRLLKFINKQVEDHLLLSINEADIYKFNQELNNIKVSFLKARVYFTDSFLYLSRFVVPIKYNKIVKIIPKITKANRSSIRTIQIYYKDVNEKIKSQTLSNLNEIDMDELLVYIPRFIEKNKNTYL